MTRSTYWKWILTLLCSFAAAYLFIVVIFGALTYLSFQRFVAHPEIPELIQLRQRTAILLTTAAPMHWISRTGSSLPVVGSQLTEVSQIYRAVQHLTADLAPLDTTTAKTWKQLSSQPDEWKLIVSALISDRELLTVLISLASSSNVTGSSSILPDWLFSSLEPFEQKDPSDLESVATSLLGLDSAQTYLLVFQNENELRPTGGFFGSYGELVIDDAALISLTAADTYTLDRSSPVSFEAPWYFEKTIAPRLYLRDANFNPHVPYTAKTILSLYAAEGGTTQFDGVVFITPQILTDILTITGPISVPNTPYIFEADTAIETLQHAVELDYAEQGIPETDRKRVLRSLLNEISSRLFSEDRTLQRAILPLASGWLQNKDVQIFHGDPAVEQSLINLGWAGEWIPSTLPTRTDIIGFTDTNLGGLKSDRVLDRGLTGSISIDSFHQAIHSLTLTTTHHGSQDPLIGDYQSFRQWSLSPETTTTSVTQERLIQATTDVYQKLSLLGYFMHVKEYETDVETIRTQSSRALSENGTSYHLYIPKQAGMRRLTIDLEITTPFEIHAIMSSGIQVTQISPNSVRVSGTLLQSGDLVLSSSL